MGATAAKTVELARTAKGEGFGSFFVPQIFGADALTTLAVVAHEVPGIDLGTFVVPTYRQHPMMMAQQALTVNAIADGRLRLGIGLSHQVVVEGMWGLSYEKPLRHMREYLAILMPLLRGEPANAVGEVLTGRGELQITAPKPEVLIAALGPNMLGLAGREADGTATWMVGPETLRSHIVPTISAAAHGAGKPAPKVAVGLPVCVTDDAAATEAVAAEEFAMYGHLPSYRAMLDREGVSGPENVAIIGSAQQVADRVGGIFDAGGTTFVANEFGTPDQRAATRELLTSLLS